MGVGVSRPSSIRLWGQQRPFLTGCRYSHCLPLRTATTALPGLSYLQLAQEHAASAGTSRSGLSTGPVMAHPRAHFPPLLL
ncbi:hypothetical protein NDU88_006399 [Pleurodeles waltl]|uniref:Uncharacterized protein n=1 Tax=Pleurodeles waltl TaxID=8319 RepID=A0AAV7NUA7_PLEWA|nr:hypothetical protein NDU88_006399 [Pleurodeles waltl]